MKLAICVLLCLGTAAFSYMPESESVFGIGIGQEQWSADSSVIGQIIAEQKDFGYCSLEFDLVISENSHKDYSDSIGQFLVSVA
uniref:Uncharacterized protein n=1 Tax=Romanomermis culicivorax TaxID=13658 RepID=A0A915HQ70_ROMCU